MSRGIESAFVVLMWYEEPNDATSDKDVKLKFISNEKATNALMSGLCEYEFIKLIHCEIVRGVQDKLENIHEGDKKVKIKMNEDKDIAKFFLRGQKVVNIMLGLSETINLIVIVQKN